jgi:hypothetical protein
LLTSIMLLLSFSTFICLFISVSKQFRSGTYDPRLFRLAGDRERKANFLRYLGIYLPLAFVTPVMKSYTIMFYIAVCLIAVNLLHTKYFMNNRRSPILRRVIGETLLLNIILVTLLFLSIARV